MAAPPSPVPSPATTPASGRLVLSLAVEPEQPRVGELVTFTFTARSNAAQPLITGMSYDGTTTSGGGPGCAAPEGPPPSPQPAEVEQVVQHRYAEPGTYTVGFSASLGCSPYQGFGTEKRELVVAP